MNVGVIATVPLAIILFVSGIYCPQTEEIFPSRYGLRSCTSHSEHVQLDSLDSTFEIVQNERNENKFKLVQKLSDNRRRKYCFRKKELEFVSLMDAEITMTIYPVENEDDKLEVTCVFERTSLARKFYRHITHDLTNTKIAMHQTTYLLKSDDTEVGTQLYISAECFYNYVTIVMDDLHDNPFLVFPTSAVSRIIQSASTEISVYIRKINDEEVSYKLGFMNEPLAWACKELLHRLCRHIRATSAEIETYHQLRNDLRYQAIFTQIDRLVLRQIVRTHRPPRRP